MLSYLRIRNLASIEDVDMRFDEGFTVLTGETGAGKTALVEGIGLLLGDRADSMRIRQGTNVAQIECVFDLSQRDEIKSELVRSGLLDPDDDELMIARSISANGKGKCSVNGRLCPLSLLAETGDVIVDLHGQNTHQALVRAGTHREYLDRFAGPDHLGTVGEYGELYSRMKDLGHEKEKLGGFVDDIERQAELLAYELEQIDEAGLKTGEIEVLEEELSRIRYGKELHELGMNVQSMLVTGENYPFSAGEMVDRSIADIKRMQTLDSTLSGLAGRLESMAYEMEDIKSELVSYVEGLDIDRGRQQEVENRINMIHDLTRKFGGSVEAVISYREEAARKLEEIELSRVRINEIDNELSGTMNLLENIAEKLTGSRKTAADLLGREVMAQLKELEMEGSVFEVSVKVEGAKPLEEKDCSLRPGPFGTDRVEFMFSPQKGLPVMPLKRIASGGEMSRVMLALKIVLAGADRIPVLVFDEVDTGIGGETALRVGEKLSQLTRHHQVFCVTHQPQIASYADRQHKVTKLDDGFTAKTKIELLSDEDRVDEICRMMGDSSGRHVTKEHARDLLKRSEKKKGQPEKTEKGVRSPGW
ncbi:MAG: DNA repair protein RecN [Actinobacteria bacterium]|nr:DNA repair protein RecN [Actinomycetota bacterium]